MKPFSKNSPLAILILSMSLLLGACSSGTRMLNRIPINKVNVKVVDQNDEPVQGAQVGSSNGRESTTNEKGIAKIRFGSVGIHTVSVYADHYMPSNFVVTMPTDRGKTITRRLASQIKFSGLNFASMNMYPLIFNYMFSSYGYSPEFDDYKEGQSTTWQVTSDDGEDALTMSKAYLKKMENGKQWWRIKLINSGDETSNYIAEILFSEDRSSVLRYREKIGDNSAQEKPVSDGWYTQPVSLTEESQEGAVKEEDVSVEVPKGTFTADMLQFGVAPETNLNIWRSKNEDIPGGVLKYEIRNEEEVVFSNQLKDYSNDATTMLDSY